MRASHVFLGGRVFTNGSTATGLAVVGERIARVGSDDLVSELIGPETVVVGLDGRLLTPGFIDAHAHPGTSGLDLLRVDFREAHDAHSALGILSRYAEENPDLEWIVGSGWSQAWFPRGCPHSLLLDGVIPDRPALLWNSDGHSAWANSLALRIAGVDETTPDPPDGRIERDEEGRPQGTLHEGAVDLVERHAPPDTASDYARGLLRGQAEFLSLGITGWQDAHVGPAMQDAYVGLAETGQLKARVVGALWWEHDRGLEQIEELVERRLRAAPGFSPTSVKLMLDGVAENFTASVLEPWLGPDGAPTDNSGIDFIEPGQLSEIVTRLDALGFQCHFHVIGDRAVRNALDAVEAALTVNGPSDNRHHLAHIQMVHPDDRPRFARLDAVANAQPLWARHETYQDELTIPFLSPERGSWQYPFASLVEAGARLAMGSDWGVSTADVMEQIDAAVTRTGDRGGAFYPQECLGPHQALEAFTAGSAYVNHSDTDTGAVRPGMLADLALLDRDPFTDGFAGTRVTMTMVGGEVVYGQPS
jgi:predicted amidohydrolase YtcJ